MPTAPPNAARLRVPIGIGALMAMGVFVRLAAVNAAIFSTGLTAQPQPAEPARALRPDASAQPTGLAAFSTDSPFDAHAACLIRPAMFDPTAPLPPQLADRAATGLNTTDLALAPRDATDLDATRRAAHRLDAPASDAESLAGSPLRFRLPARLDPARTQTIEREIDLLELRPGVEWLAPCTAG